MKQCCSITWRPVCSQWHDHAFSGYSKSENIMSGSARNTNFLWNIFTLCVQLEKHSGENNTLKSTPQETSDFLHIFCPPFFRLEWIWVGSLYPLVPLLKQNNPPTPWSWLWLWRQNLSPCWQPRAGPSGSCWGQQRSRWAGALSGSFAVATEREKGRANI